MGLIWTGEVKAGEPLPPERELCERLGVSRTSVRNAVAALTESGKLDGRWGSGNYVMQRAPQMVLQRDEGFSTSIRGAGMTPSYRMLVSAVRPAPAEVASRLEVEEASPAYYLKRLVLADGAPACLQESWVDLGMFPGLDRHDFGRESLHRVLVDEYHVPVRHNMAQVSVERISAEEGDLMELDAGSAVLRMDGINRDADLVPVESYREIFALGRLAIVSDTTNDNFCG